MPDQLMGVTTLASGDYEAIRKQHLGREANIRGMAILMYLNAISFILLGGVYCIALLAVILRELFLGQVEQMESFASFLLCGLSGLVCALGVWIWRGASDLRRLSKTGRPAGYVYSMLNLINVPIGTLLGISMIVFLSGEKGRYVLSPEYRDIVAATPEIKASWSIVTKVLLGFLVALILLAMIAVAFAPQAS